MSTTFDWDTAPQVLAVGRPVAVIRRAAAPDAATTDLAHDAGEALQPAQARRALLRQVPARRSLLPWLGSAWAFGLAMLLISSFGIVYIMQISHVAQYGYQLSSMQRQQAKLESENQLLQYRLSGEQTLARASDIAGPEYGMQPFAGVPRPPSTAVTANRGPVTTANKPAPQVRFITAQRLPAAASPSLPATPPETLLDRLWNRIVGIGTASAVAR